MPLYFDTDLGPVEIIVDAYVVKGMTTAFILGNDFADQYALSLVRNNNGSTIVLFGGSGCSLKVQNSVGPSITESNGMAFMIESTGTATESKNITLKEGDNSVHALQGILIPPQISVMVPVAVNFPKDHDTIFVEKMFISNRNEEDLYAVPDSLISKNYPKLHVANFSSFPVRIHQGQVLGLAHNPNSWLTRSSEFSKEKLLRLSRQALTIRTLVETFDKRSPRTNSLGQDEAIGGPKSAEIPPNDVASSDLFKEIDISRGLNSDQVKALKGIISRNQEVFGLDGRLGHYSTKVEIPLKEGTKEISLLPFFASPKSREIINEQMDKWLKLEVIEPSKSPWGAPAFIVY